MSAKTDAPRIVRHSFRRKRSRRHVYGKHHHVRQALEHQTSGGRLLRATCGSRLPGGRTCTHSCCASARGQAQRRLCGPAARAQINQHLPLRCQPATLLALLVPDSSTSLHWGWGGANRWVAAAGCMALGWLPPPLRRLHPPNGKLGVSPTGSRWAEVPAGALVGGAQGAVRAGLQRGLALIRDRNGD